MHTNGQAAQAAVAAVESYNEQAKQLEAMRREVQEDIARHGEQLNQALTDLSIDLLPRWDLDVVKATVRVTAYGALEDRFLQMEQEHQDRIAKMQELEAADAFRNRDRLLDPQRGTLTQGMRDAEEKIAGLVSEIQRHENHVDFQRVLRDSGRKPLERGWVILGRILIVGWICEMIRKNREERVRTEFRAGSVGRVIENYQALKSSLAEWQQELNRLKNEHASLVARVKYHAKILEVTKGYPTTDLKELRRELIDFFHRTASLKVIRKRMGEEQKMPLTTVIVLKEKLRYLQSMNDFLAREIVQRQQVANKIESVRRKWRRSPGKRLRGDKTEWLINGPARKATTTEKQIRQIRTCCQAISDFDKYVLYDHLLDELEDFLSYDVFSRCADVRMPNESFVCQVIPDVSEYREEHGDRDYSAIDSIVETGSASMGGIAIAGASAALALEALDSGWNDFLTGEETGVGEGDAGGSMEDVS